MPGKLPPVGRNQIVPFLFLPTDLPFYQEGVLASLLRGWVPASARGAPLVLAAHAPHAALPCDCFLSLPLPNLSFTLSCRTLPAGVAAAVCLPAPAPAGFIPAGNERPLPPAPPRWASGTLTPWWGFPRCRGFSDAGCAAGPSSAGLWKLAGLLALSSCRASSAGLDFGGA